MRGQLHHLVYISGSPAIGMLKCNIDVAFVDNKLGIGVCFREHESQFIKAKTITYSSLLHVRDEEAFGLLQLLNGSVNWTSIILYLS